MSTKLDSTREISRLLDAYREGSDDAFESLVSVLYPELRRLARRERRRSGPSRTLNTTALLHEAYLKLVPGGRSWRDRGHFLAAAGQAMRHILVDAARRRLSAKQGGGQTPETLDEELGETLEHDLEILAVDTALERLKRLDERLCRVVEYRFFAGMTEKETATILEVSPRTVNRDWLRARGWLRNELGRAGGRALQSAEVG